MKVMTVSDCPTIFSGLARVHRHVIDALVQGGHSVLPLAWFGYDSETLARVKNGEKSPLLSYKSGDTNVQVLNIPKANGYDSMYAVYDAADAFDPDVVLTIGDHWDFYYMHAVKQKRGFKFKWVAYLTIERDEIEDKWLPLLKYADKLVVPSAFGQAVLGKYGFDSVVIPYGAEDAFRRYPEDRRKELRDCRKCDGKVRFVTVAQNTIRKNLPALVQAVEQLAHRDPDKVMQFYLHTNFGRSDPMEGFFYDLKKIISKLGVQDWFVFPQDERACSMFKAPADQVLVDEYNAGDFFVLPSHFEGYGLPVVEAMACGLPAVATGSSTMPEHLGAKPDQGYGFGSRGFLVSSRVEIHPPDLFIKTVRPDALAHAIWEMRCLATDPKRAGELATMRANCEAYGSGLTWGAMRKRLAEEVSALGGVPLTIPVEVL